MISERQTGNYSAQPGANNPEYVPPVDPLVDSQRGIHPTLRETQELVDYLHKNSIPRFPFSRKRIGPCEPGLLKDRT